MVDALKKELGEVIAKVNASRVALGMHVRPKRVHSETSVPHKRDGSIGDCRLIGSCSRQ